MLKQIEIIWNIDDVLDRHPELTKKQASKVLEIMEDSHDCNVGINWEFIDACVDEMLEEEAQDEK